MDMNITTADGREPWGGVEIDADAMLVALRQAHAAKEKFDALPQHVKDAIREGDEIYWEACRVKFQNSPIGRALAASQFLRDAAK